MKDEVLQRAVQHALSGEGAHVEVNEVFKGLDWKRAGERPAGVAHSVFETLNHISFWQDWAVQWLDGEDPAIPRHAAGSWPGGRAPASAGEWTRARARLGKGQRELAKRVRGAVRSAEGCGKTPLEMLHTIGAHNSYHAGQVAQLRQMLGCWPPPSGGVTW
ncbi:MAG: DinB family protein [Gemmatimonadales bacterium]|jgi:uncharacterized damage-inducible protein DinB